MLQLVIERRVDRRLMRKPNQFHAVLCLRKPGSEAQVPAFQFEFRRNLVSLQATWSSPDPSSPEAAVHGTIHLHTQPQSLFNHIVTR